MFAKVSRPTVASYICSFDLPVLPLNCSAYYRRIPQPYFVFQAMKADERVWELGKSHELKNAVL